MDARATTGSAVDAVLGDSVIVKYGDYTYTDRTDYTDAHAGLKFAALKVQRIMVLLLSTIITLPQ